MVSGSEKHRLNFNHPCKYLVWAVDNSGANHSFNCGSSNPVQDAVLQLNGHDRFQKRDGSYFGNVQPIRHFNKTPVVGINVYSFAINPLEHQPSGTCNFSRIDNATLNINWDSSYSNGCNIYAVNYNL